MRAMPFAFDGFSFTRSAMGVDYHLIPQMHVLFFGPIACAWKISPARLAGVICNSRNVAGERELVSKFAEELGSKLISFIPRDDIVQKAEISRKTVIEYAPESNQAAEYDALAARVEDNAEFCTPTLLSQERLEQLMIECGM